MVCLEPYAPIDTLKPVAKDLWIVDGPVICMSYLGFRLPFTTRMTVIRLADGALWLHSPTPPDTHLCREIDRLGKVRFLVAPNKLHYWWIGAWTKRYRQAVTYAAPGVRAYARERIPHFDHDLGVTVPAEWWADLDLVSVPGDFLTEIDFFHRPSRTLILTDLIENFEQAHVTCWHLELRRAFRWVL